MSEEEAGEIGVALAEEKRLYEEAKRVGNTAMTKTLS
jgi:hypothetical protein